MIAFAPLLYQQLTDAVIYRFFLADGVSLDGDVYSKTAIVRLMSISEHLWTRYGGI